MRNGPLPAIPLACLLALPVWADETVKAEEGTESSARTAPADAADDAERTAAVEATAEEQAQVEAEVEKFFRRNGYVPVEKNGVRYYCRDEATLGSRLKKPACITREAAQARRENARRMMEEKFGQRSWKESG